MTSSLVGSEMCIRDSLKDTRPIPSKQQADHEPCPGGDTTQQVPGHIVWAVSYTHLTLPTICSV
eukprot:4174370-Prorocentrum_lima.AAC.1